MEAPTPTDAHRWLRRLVGEWTMEGECVMAPGAEPMKSTGSEIVRPFGDLWIIAEGRMPGLEGGEMLSRMMLGYDPQRQRIIGTWACTAMANMFVYEGVLDLERGVVPLDTTGPHFADPAKTARYQDVIELPSNDRRVLWSQMLGDDGKWVRFMTANYTRVK